MATRQRLLDTQLSDIERALDIRSVDPLEVKLLDLGELGYEVILFTEGLWDEAVLAKGISRHVAIRAAIRALSKLQRAIANLDDPQGGSV